MQLLTEHLWSESYDRPVDDIFTIQREVALGDRIGS
jgi:TolB-like protein